MSLTAEERQRYHRQLELPEVGEEGQKRLRRAGVLVAGAGGLGSPAALYLAAAGVGRLGLVDGDCVELSNLQRQILHTTPDLGRPKVDSARDRLAALNPLIAVETHWTRITRENAGALVAGFDLVIMALDNRETRYILNEACYAAGKPLIEGAVGGFSGQVTVFLPPAGPCYQCLYPMKSGQAETRPAGLLGTLPGVIGAIQANEALKLLLGLGHPPAGRLLIYDALTAETSTIAIAADPACPVCGRGAADGAQ